MAQNDILKRSIDAGLSFTSMTQRRAEALVRDLVNAGVVQADQAREAVTELLERRRKNSERLLEAIRREVRAQITALGLVRRSDLDRIERRISSLLGTAAPASQPTATTNLSATKAMGARKGAKKDVPAKVTAVKKGAVKKGAVKKAAAAPVVARPSAAIEQTSSEA